LKHELVVKLHGQFEESARIEDGIEYWPARELQALLGYTDWRNFLGVIDKAKTACANSGHGAEDHFVDANRMVDIGSGTQREIEDIALTRYACYLIAQNGDPRKQEIAFAQTYFAIQTRRQELIEKRLVEIERVQARKKLTNSEKELSGIIFERIGDNSGFARIRSKGDRALFGGKTTQDMKGRLDVPANRPLADFLPTITIKAKDFANEITNFNIKKDDLETEGAITEEHVKNNEDVRKILTDRNIRPEDLPPAEDAKKVDRRLASEEKRLIAGMSKSPVKAKKPKAKK
jgi:DNA-damage-inducible protein D